MDVIEKEVAEKEVDSILNFFSIDTTDATDSIGVLRSLVRAGRLSLNRETGALRLHLAAPLKLDNGEKIDFFDFSEPTAGDLKCLDRYKRDEAISKTLHLVSRMTGQPLGVVEKVTARDMSAFGAVAALFF